MSKEILRAENIKMYFPKFSGGKKVMSKIVDDVSLYINEGETLGLVGESSCGKSTLAKTLLYIYKPTDGKIYFEGKEITESNRKDFCCDIQMIFQDPYSSVDPRMTVEDIIGEPLDIHHLYSSKEERKEKISKLMDEVGLSPQFATRYPHEFSGGQRQRIGIARALALNPKLIICDEPVSALDVSIQAQVLNMFDDLRKNSGISFIFISHDLLVVKHISDRVAVMYLGRIVELAKSEDLYDNPLHPYTRALLSSILPPDPKTARDKEFVPLGGEVPSHVSIPSGCAFRTRCPYATENCAEERPELKDAGNGHMVACLNIKQ